MASADALCRKLLCVKNCVAESRDIYNDKDDAARLRMKARPDVWHQDDCPFRGKRRPGHDRPSKRSKVWRGLDYGGILVEIEYRTHRIQCSEHGIITASVPWAYPDSSFTREFDPTVAWLAKHLPRSAVTAYTHIDRQTVGNCVSRALHDLEPERSRRLDGLVNIGIDETGCRRGHKCITVIVNHDANELSGWPTDTASKSWSRSARAFRQSGLHQSRLLVRKPGRSKTPGSHWAKLRNALHRSSSSVWK